MSDEEKKIIQEVVRQLLKSALIALIACDDAISTLEHITIPNETKPNLKDKWEFVTKCFKGDRAQILAAMEAGKTLLAEL